MEADTDKVAGNISKADKSETGCPQKLALLWPQTHNLFQPPPAQALVIERMHSGNSSHPYRLLILF